MQNFDNLKKSSSPITVEPCGPNQVYSPCNSPVIITCVDHLNGVVPEPNEDAAISVGCYCAEGFKLDGHGNCVSATDCGCLYGDGYLEVCRTKYHQNGLSHTNLE